MAKNYTDHSLFKEITRNPKNWKNAFVVLDTFSATNIKAFRESRFFDNLYTIGALSWFEFCKKNGLFTMSLNAYKKAWYCISFWRRAPKEISFTHFVHSIFGEHVFGNSKTKFNAFRIEKELGDYSDSIVDLSYTPFFEQRSTYKSEIQGNYWISFKDLKKQVFFESIDAEKGSRGNKR